MSPDQPEQPDHPTSPEEPVTDPAPDLRVPPGGSDPTGESDAELDPVKLADAVRDGRPLDPAEASHTGDPIADMARRTHPDIGGPTGADDELDPTKLAARIPRGL